MTTQAQDTNTNTALSFPVIPANDKLPVPAGMERLIYNFRLTEAAKKEGKKERGSVQVDLPIISYPDLSGPLADYLAASLSDLRKTSLKATIDAEATSIPAEATTLDAMLAYYQQSSTSSRLTKDAIAAWVKQFAPVMFASDTPEKQDAKSATLLTALEKLAATVPVISQANAGLALAVVLRVPEQDGGAVQAAMAKKLDRIANPPQDAAMLLDAL